MRNTSVIERQRAGRVTASFLFVAGAATIHLQAAQTTLLNASFDVSRQLFQEVNAAFSAHWKTQSGEVLLINQSHGGSSKQARAVIEGLDADVVTLNQSSDIDVIAQSRGLIPANWAQLLPHHSAPYTSAVVFLARKGNPKKIKDWDDLVKPGVSIVIPNPRISGNGRYGYLSAYAFALDKSGQSEAKAREFVGSLFRNAPILDAGGRGATTTFVERGIGDVLVSFEAEILQVAKEHPDKFVVVTPSQSIEAEMPVAVVERVARHRGTDRVARAYLEFLYTEEGQEIIARNFYRPRSAAVLARYDGQFGTLKLRNAGEIFGSRDKIQKIHFAEGGIFDQIYRERR